MRFSRGSSRGWNSCATPASRPKTRSRGSCGGLGGLRQAVGMPLCEACSSHATEDQEGPEEGAAPDGDDAARFG